MTSRITIPAMLAIMRGLLCLCLSVSHTALATTLVAPIGLPPVPARFQHYDPQWAELGRRLFYDARLSADGSVSCASCHQPSHSLADQKPRAIGLHQQSGTRNTPSLYNVIYSTSLFWDGRSPDLESQARSPLFNSREHGLTTDSQMVAIVKSDPDYRRRFRRALGHQGLTGGNVRSALAGYERTLLAANSPFDRYVYGNDLRAMSPAAIRGMAFFRGSAGCASCHTIGKQSALLTDEEFHASPQGLPANVDSHLVELYQRVMAIPKDDNSDERGALISSDLSVASLGRFVVTADPKDIGLFRTPSLRNVAKTGPYLHDGSLATLAEVVEAELYSRGDSVHSPIPATVEERADLVEFLNALSSPE